MRVPYKDIKLKFEEFDKKLERQKESQMVIFLLNFGIIYALLGFTVIVTVLATSKIHLLLLLIIGVVIMFIGVILILVTSRTAKYPHKIKKKEVLEEEK